MTPSRSKHIELESVPLKDLPKSPVGTFGLYVPARDEDGRTQLSVARISSAAKSFAVNYNKRCVVQQVLLLEKRFDDDTPAPVSMIKITITSGEEVSLKGMRYNEANHERLAMARQRKKEKQQSLKSNPAQSAEDPNE
ncbi:hypothetical protein ACT3UJ_06325 [Halomonas sp. 86]|uniref:hypothetical protein n=1 Tax=unclassified Halomonas TaxID=2609666 RepID=UPI0040349D61